MNDCSFNHWLSGAVHGPQFGGIMNGRSFNKGGSSRGNHHSAIA
jgi:hypothetical protein